MKLRDRLTARVRKIVPALVLLSALCAPTPAQTTEPRREQLLNGLRVLLVARPGEPQALVRLRVHSGAAFDLAGKEGVMALLGDALFSDPTTREYVSEDLGGRLEVSTGYDSIDVTLTGKAEEFERLVELLRAAVLNTQLSPEAVTRLRDARLKAVKDVSVSPSVLADRALATRLFGATFPYGRIVEGTPESLARVERADLLLVRERFLNPNNSTLVVVGVEPTRALRAVRQYLGPWRKSDRDVPATFRQPEAPDARTLVVDLSGAPDAEVRLAVRGLARSDRDASVARLVAVLARERWLKSFPELKGRPFFVEHRAYVLPGLLRAGASVMPDKAARALETARAALQSLVTTAPSAEELELARRELLAPLNAHANKTDTLAELWLDREFYQTDSAEEARSLSNATPADVQRVAARLLRNSQAAAVAVGDAARLRPELARAGEVEVSGASTAPSDAPRPAPTPRSKPFSVPVRRP